MQIKYMNIQARILIYTIPILTVAFKNDKK